MRKDLSAHFNSLVAMAVAFLVHPLFPDAPPEMIAEALPFLAGVRFNDVGSLLTFLILWRAYAAVWARFRRQETEVAKRNVEDD